MRNLDHRKNPQFAAAFTVLLRVICGLLTAGVASAQSHPGWWTFAPPDSRSLVGIQWQKLRDSPFGDALRAELWSTGSVGFPDLPCLLNTKDFLIASPPLLAAASGGCAPVELRAEALGKGLRSVRYRGFDLWIGSALNVAQFNDRVVLVGARKSLEAAIDRSLADTHTYSPLLMAGARLARTRDLWVVATELPDPLASIFVPLDFRNGKPVGNFEGGVSFHEGLDAGAIFDAGSESGAAEVAATIRKSIPQFAAVAKGLQIAASGRSVTLALQVAGGDLRASLRQADAGAAQAQAVPSQPTPAPPPAGPKFPTIVTPMAAVTVATVAPSAPKDKAAPATAVSLAPTKPEPQIIRIYGLAEGTREIILPKEPQ
jgi:hypothetical protein